MKSNKEFNTVVYIDNDSMKSDNNKLNTVVKALNENYSLIRDYSSEEIKDLIKSAANRRDIDTYFYEKELKKLYRENGFDESLINYVAYDMLNNPILSQRKRNELKQKAINSQSYIVLPSLFFYLNNILSDKNLIDFITYNPITHYGVSQNDLQGYLIGRYTYKAKNEEQQKKGKALNQIMDICKVNDIDGRELDNLLTYDSDNKLKINLGYFFSL